MTSPWRPLWLWRERCATSITRSWHSFWLPFFKLTQPLPLLVSIVAGILLATNGQCREIFLVLVEEGSGQTGWSPYLKPLFGLLSFSLLAWVLFSAYMASTSSQQAILYGHLSRAFLTPELRWWRLALAIGTAVAPFVGILAGLYAVRDTASDIAFRLMVMTAAVGGLTALCLWAGRSWRRLRRFSRGALPLIVALLITITTFSVGEETIVLVSRLLGPLAIIGLQVLAGYLTIGVVKLLAERHWRTLGIISMIWVVLALVAAGLDLVSETRKAATDMAGLLSPPAMQQSEPAPPDMVDEFRTWAATLRNEWSPTRKEPVPVFLVAAEGGGVYAASAVASFMTRMRQECPRFARHVFSISGVSGGAVGAAIDSAMAEAGTADRTCGAIAGGRSDHSALGADRVRAVLQDDHLSPVIAVLVPEVTYRLVVDLGLLAASPFRKLAEMSPIHMPARLASMWRGIGDSIGTLLARRDKLLAKSLLCRSTGVLTIACDGSFASRLRADHDQHWREGRPGLILNTTQAETGRTVAFAPFRLKGLGDDNITSFFDQPFSARTSRPSLLGAAISSARFPGVLPPYQVRTEAGTLNFVDGGYADNSGVAVAGAIFAKLRQVEPNVALHMILVTSEATEGAVHRLAGHSAFIDVIVPVQTVLSVRERIATREVARLVNQFADAPSPGSSPPVIRISIGGGFFLGWSISRHTLCMIEKETKASGVSGGVCRARHPIHNPTPDMQRRERENAEAVAAIERLLRPR